MAGLLDGMRVVEVAHPHTEYAGLIWAGLGAEVWLVEPPGGAATRLRLPRMPNADAGRRCSGASGRGSIPFLARNGGKKSVALDAASPADAGRLKRLCQHADVTLSTTASPFHDIVRAADARVAVTITDGLGLGVSSIVPFAASGGMASSGWPHQPPCNAPSWLALDGAGVYAAAMAAVGVLATRAGGAVRYEVPLAEAAVASITPWTRCLHAYGMQAAGQGALTARLGASGFPIYETRDGHVRILAGTPKQWRAFVALLGEPDEIVSGPFADPTFRAENADALKLLCASLIRERGTEELFLAGQRLGLTISPVCSLRQFREDLHVAARGVFAATEDPEFGPLAQVRTPLVADPASLNVPPRSAPALDEHRSEALAIAAAPARERPRGSPPRRLAPLAGLRVLNLGVGAVVPEAASLLALLGAEVVKVESLAHVDFLRRNGLAGTMDVNNSPTFNQLNLGVLSLAVDLRTEAGVAVLRQLAAKCDVVMENMRGPIAARWGLDYAGARALRPDVVYLRSQGLGTGPYDGFQTYGPNLQTFSGITCQWAHPDDPFPVGTTLNHPDHIAGKQALVPLLAALLRRDLTGAGCLLDATQVETAAFLIGEKHLEQSLVDEDVAPLGNRSRDFAPHGCYRCADDADGNERWLALAVETNEQWATLQALVPSLADLPASTTAERLVVADAIDEALAAHLRERDVAAMEAALRQAGVPASRVVTGDDMAASDAPFFPALSHPTAGTRHHTGVPVLVDGERLPLRRAPLLGEHTEQVLHEVLNLPSDEIERLTAAKAVGY